MGAVHFGAMYDIISRHADKFCDLWCRSVLRVWPLKLLVLLHVLRCTCISLTEGRRISTPVYLAGPINSIRDEWTGVVGQQLVPVLI